MLKIAFKMLFHSRKKFIGMVIGATFSAFILMQQPGIYQGVTDRLVAQIHSIQEIDLWIMDKKSSTFDQPTHFNAMDIYRVKSVPGVLWAVQLYRMWYPLKHLKTEKTMGWEMLGVDPARLIGLPTQLTAGYRDTIHHSNALIIDGYSLNQYETRSKKTIQLNDIMDGGGRHWTVTGITKPLRTYSYEPKVYIASNHIQNVGDYSSFILVKVNPSSNIQRVAHDIQKLTHYDALTPGQFSKRSMAFFQQHTPIIINFISVAVLGFIIGLIMMWQIFSNFILTHVHQFGMLKMLGVSNAMLIKMVSSQAAMTGGLGYMIGLILTILFGLASYDTIIAFHLTWQIAAIGALGTLINVALSSYFAILKVLRLDTIDLCRDTN
ncbi:MAG: ABC transporter permease [Legionellales bacterium]|nr:ABC transporter permease [Legionellales bacterium]